MHHSRALSYVRMTQNQERCLFHTYLPICVAVFSLQEHERMYSPYQQLQEDPPMQSTMCLFCNKDAVSGLGASCGNSVMTN